MPLQTAPERSRSTAPSRARDVSFGPQDGKSRWDETPKHRDRSATPSTRDRTPSAPSPVKMPAGGYSTPRRGNFRGDTIWFKDDLTSHSASRAMHREASGRRSEAQVDQSPVDQPKFGRGPRFAEHLTQENRPKTSRHIVHRNAPQQPKWEQTGFAGKRVKNQQPRGKRCFIGAPHTADTPGMAEMVCGSEQMAEFWEEVEHENPSMAAIFNGYAGYSDQAADANGERITGTRHFWGAPHVTDTQGLEQLICGSDKLTELKDQHETKHGDLSGMLKGLAGRTLQLDDDGESRARSKKNFLGAPHTQDTPLSGVLCGSDKMQEYRQKHLEKYRSQERMFDGHAGLSLQADDAGTGPVRRQGKRDFGGAPHVADSQDVLDLVCGSPTLKEAHAKKTNPSLQNMFDGCAGLYLQDEDLEGPRSRGKKKVNARSVYHSSVGQQCFENAFQPSESPSSYRSEMPKLPTLFISHGIGPMPLLLDEAHPFRRSLAEIPSRLQLDEENVRCILVISAHWETKGGLEVTLRRTHGQGLLYDYAGAPEKTYEVHQRFHPPGDAEVSGWILDLLSAAGKEVRHNSGRNLDHGVFVPLTLMPELMNIPVVQLSLPALSGQRGAEVAQHCLEVGRALAPLRSRGVLIIGSGLASTASAKPQHLERWAEQLKRLCCKAQPAQRYEGLRQWTYMLPHAREVHGREDHLLPLHVVAGAALDDRGQVLADLREHDRAMTHFTFG